MPNLRKVEKKVGDTWQVVRLQDIKCGDVFRMSESVKEEPFGQWIAKENAKRKSVTGIWEVFADDCIIKEN